MAKKYIDAEKLKAAIEKGTPDYLLLVAYRDIILSLIDSLQQEQPETDLEKEIANWLEKGDITDTRFDDYSDLDIERTAHHFYELGLNARKV